MPDDAQIDPGRIIEKLRRELDARTAERDEALAQQAAISEILQIINSSRGDLEPVFDAIARKGAHAVRAPSAAACSSGMVRNSAVWRCAVFPESMVEWLRQGYIPGPETPRADLSSKGSASLTSSDLAEIGVPGRPRRRGRPGRCPDPPLCGAAQR